MRKKLLALYFQNKLFEWTRSQIIECLCRSQKFSVKERQIVFPMLANETSWFVKRFIYKLLLMQTDDKQLFKSIVAAAQKETYGPLKINTLLVNYWLRGGLTREQIIEILVNEFSNSKRGINQLMMQGPLRLIFHLLMKSKMSQGLIMMKL